MLVTGAASGMGRAIAELFARRGRDGRGHRSRRRRRRVAAEIADAGDGTRWALDVADRDAIDQRRRRGRRRARADRHPRQLRGREPPRADRRRRLRRRVGHDARGEPHRLRAHDPRVPAAPRRATRAAASSTSRRPKASARRRTSRPYTVEQARRRRLTRSLACELGPQGVTVNCICPGPIRTGMTAPIPDDAKERSPAAASRCAATATPRRSRTWC